MVLQGGPCGRVGRRRTNLEKTPVPITGTGVFCVSGTVAGMTYKIRSIRADEWAQVKELRLEALRDPVAHLAFLETFDQAAAQPDSFWQERAIGGAEGATGAQQIIAEGPDGEWVGT